MRQAIDKMLTETSERQRRLYSLTRELVREAESGSIERKMLVQYAWSLRRERRRLEEAIIKFRNIEG